MHTAATDAHGTAENSYMVVSAILHNCPLWCNPFSFLSWQSTSSINQ